MMAAVVPTCPFCNAPLAQVAPAAAGVRVLCPRCGEPLPAAVNEQLAVPPLDNSPAVPSGQVATPTPPGKTNTLLAILAVMVTMAVLGGVYALRTQQYRRG